MLQGLRSQIYQVSDLEAAKAWYKQLLGKPPYFDEPFYVGFEAGGYELGLQPVDPANAGQAGEAVTYWGVPNADAAYAKLLELGAAPYQPVQEAGGGIKLGAARDPVGGLLGVIENPHFVAAFAEANEAAKGPGVTFSLHIDEGLLGQARSGARSARVSLEEYLGECATDGIIRGYR